MWEIAIASMHVEDSVHPAVNRALNQKSNSSSPGPAPPLTNYVTFSLSSHGIITSF